ncbi:MAG: GNAT family N-acetyltransferase [Bacillota bacterium]|nr:GNAT family N-acetyltransferase [Bacillota bacterium]
MAMLIRSIELNDAENFLELSKEIDESNFMLYEPGEKQITVAQQRKIFEKVLSERNSNFLVAEVEHQLVGFIAALGSNLMRNRHCVHLALGVHENFHGQGIATMLFERLFEWAKKQEITRLELTVIKDNYKAFNLYQKMGFVLEGEKVHSLIINGEPVNEYYLYKLLSCGYTGREQSNPLG